jgi:hypothetical protein
LNFARHRFTGVHTVACPAKQFVIISMIVPDMGHNSQTQCGWIQFLSGSRPAYATGIFFAGMGCDLLCFGGGATWELDCNSFGHLRSVFPIFLFTPQGLLFAPVKQGKP